MIKLNYNSFQVLFWVLVPAFYSFKDSYLPGLEWKIAQYLVFAGAGFFITHLYQKKLSRSDFRFNDFFAVARKVSGTLLLLALLSAAFDFVVDRFAFGKGFRTEAYYWVTLFSYAVDGFVIFLPWFMVYHLYKYASYTAVLEKKATLQALELKNLQLQNLANKLNPHFLFNALNTVRWLINAHPEKARRAVDEISDLLRYTINQDTLQPVPLREELSIVEKYLQLEQIRFDDRLQYSIHCSPDCLLLKVPPYLLLNLVENGVTHGISQRSEGGLLQVLIDQQSGMLMIQVTNPGEWRMEEEGFGLTSIRTLLKTTYGQTSDIHTNIRDHQVTTMIKVPAYV
ncbi:histidine kinase [Rhodocytophaga aerolata]|uniref:Histidine kinase n=1 Tax=Rhodocytophaga aerolata TaxID=455078 RepID=A0ABT8RK39_9BACT|nr:histidine kinase [Rhodocytophaga aerolata]MDO1451688.1 histidine kinase [Rhodocytophaga aerolata]